MSGNSYKLCEISALALAYLGDAVWEAYVRRRLIEEEGISVTARSLHTKALKLVSATGQAGLLREFEKLLTDKALRAALVEIKKEGVRNGVDATPTLFINGRKYEGDLDPVLVADVLAEEYDVVAGTTR